MSFESISNVLDRVTAFHEEAGRYYSRLNSSNKDERTRLLLQQLIEQQQQQGDELRAYCADADQAVLATMVQFPAEDDLWKEPRIEMNAAGDLTIEGVSAAMVMIDNRILQLYAQLRQEQLPPAISEIFDRLAEQQATVAKKHSFDVQGNGDL